MNASKFINLSSSEKKQVIKSAIHGANKEQKDLVERYKKEIRGDDRVCVKN